MMKTLPYFYMAFLFCATFCLPQLIIAQTNSIQGRILDKNTNIPVSFASVSVCGTSIGVVSNESGDFVLNMGRDSGNTICISSIGYETYRLDISTSNNGLNMILLIPKPYVLSTVEISGKGKKQLHPWQIVKRAIKNIRDNYPDEGFTQTGYYRDYQKVNGEYLNLMEAALVVHDPGFQKRDFYHSAVKLIEHRYAPGFVRDETLQGGYRQEEEYKKFLPGAMLNYRGGNEWAILRLHDPIRNHRWKSFSFIDFIRKDFVPNHNFNLDSLSYLNDKVIHCISFVFKDYLANHSNRDTKYNASGNIYIQAETFEIVQMNYQVDVDHDLYTGKLCELQLAYKPFNGKMQLNYLSFSNYFEMWKRVGEETERKSAVQYREFFVNEILEGTPTEYASLAPLDKETGLMDIPLEDNPIFWKTYNYIRVKPLQK